MTLNNFLSYFQQLLTMINPEEEHSVELARKALFATFDLVRATKKVDARTLRAMNLARRQFQFFAEHAEDFAGSPGEYRENEQKRRRLEMMLTPHC